MKGIEIELYFYPSLPPFVIIMEEKRLIKEIAFYCVHE